VTMKYLIETE